MDISLIKNNSIIITPSNLKNACIISLNNSDTLLNVKVLTDKEFINHVMFSYDNNAILYLMDKYHYNSNVSKILIENMYYVEDKNYSSDKLNNLVILRKELLDSNLLERDNLFDYFLKDKNIYLFGYDNLDFLLKKSLEKYNYEIIKREDKNISNDTVYVFDTIEEEVEFIFEEIGKLLDKGIDINNIKIVGSSEKYNSNFSKLSKFYHIPIEDKGYYLYATDICHNYLELLKENHDFSKSIDLIKEKYQKESEVNLVNILVNITNKYIGLDYSFDSIIELLIDDLKNYKIKTKQTKALEFTSLNKYLYNKDNYIFLIGLNQNEIPKLYKDEDYISDFEKEEIDGIDTARKNKNEKERVSDFIKNIDNLTMSYSLKHLSNTYHPSNLISELNLKEKRIVLDSNIYSKEYSHLKLTKYLDDFIKFGTINPNLSSYYYNYKIPYLTYDNKYQKIDKDKILKKLDNKLLLSYSSLNNYNKCHFRYYLDNIMKINKYEETFKIKVGNLFHYLLSICFNSDFDLDKEWNKYIKNLELSNKDLVLLVKLKEEFKLILEFVYNLHHETGLTDTLMEKKIYIDKSKYNLNISFMGIIDKCMTRNKNDGTLVSIIDYKTGNPDLNLYKMAYGIDIQLPLYWYLIKKGNLFDNPKFVGIYLEKILHSELKRDTKKEFKDRKLETLKLVGYSTNNKDRLEVFDTTYENSTFIKSMKVKNDGEFYNYTKILDDDILEEMVLYLDKIIDEDIDNILSSNFDINPLEIDGDNLGCKYCKYKDICFIREEDKNKKKGYTDFSFLGGDINAQLD